MYISDVDQHPKKIDFHRPLRKRPTDVRRIDDSIYDPYLWEKRRPGAVPTNVRRVDDGHAQFRVTGNRLYGHRRQTNVQPHPNHNYSPQVPLQPTISKPPYHPHQYFNPHYNPIKNYHSSPWAHSPARRKDAQRFGSGGYPGQQVKTVEVIRLRVFYT